MLKIAILGSHGSGKSTLCFMLASYYKQKGFNVKIVQETVRECPFPLNHEMSYEAAFWIYHTHIKKELDALSQGVELCICDRSALDSLIYIHDKFSSTAVSRIVEQSAIQWLTTYDLLVHVIPNPNYKVTGDPVRPADQQYQDDINAAFGKYIKSFPDEITNKLITIQAGEVFADFHTSRAVSVIDQLCQNINNVDKLQELLEISNYKYAPTT